MIEQHLLIAKSIDMTALNSDAFKSFLIYSSYSHSYIFRHQSANTPPNNSSLVISHLKSFTMLSLSFNICKLYSCDITYGGMLFLNPFIIEYLWSKCIDIPTFNSHTFKFLFIYSSYCHYFSFTSITWTFTGIPIMLAVFCRVLPAKGQ